jgi:hypothetical protein
MAGGDYGKRAGRFPQIWPEFCIAVAGIAVHPSCTARSRRQTAGDCTADSRANIMKQDNGTFGLIVGGLVALAAVFFIMSGGELGGKTVINGDEDLPPIATADRN